MGSGFGRTSWVMARTDEPVLDELLVTVGVPVVVCTLSLSPTRFRSCFTPHDVPFELGRRHIGTPAHKTNKTDSSANGTDERYIPVLFQRKIASSWLRQPGFSVYHLYFEQNKVIRTLGSCHYHLRQNTVVSVCCACQLPPIINGLTTASSANY